MMSMTTTGSEAPWWPSKCRVTFDNELGIVGNVTLRFAADGGSFIRPITKRYGESISLESYIPTKSGESTNPNDEIMSKDTCYLTDEEITKRVEIIEEKNKAYIEGFGYVAPVKTKTIIVDSDCDINKMVGK